jgi:hypothetical protein
MILPDVNVHAPTTSALAGVLLHLGVVSTMSGKHVFQLLA